MASDGVKYALPTREKKEVQKVQGVFGSHTFLTEEQVRAGRSRRGVGGPSCTTAAQGASAWVAAFRVQQHPRRAPERRCPL